MRIANAVAALRSLFTKTRRVRSNAPELVVIIERNYDLAKDFTMTGTPVLFGRTRIVREE